jgi:hypothetical protein
MNRGTCRGCGKPIVWGLTPDNKRIPLDPRPPVYLAVELADGTVSCDRIKDGMVSHFATCPKAAEFSRGRKP